jgi:hypothetical protein
MATALKRHQHDDRDHRSGRYQKSPACDGCGKPVGTNYYTDDAVCGGGDGPGFYVCDRKRCQAALSGLSADQRRAVYVATRERLDAFTAPPKHSCEVERTIKRTHGTLNMGTGAYTVGRSEVVTEACNTPLFGGKNEDMARGVCGSCRKGWTHPDNAATEKGKALIAASLAAQPVDAAQEV